MPEEKILTDDIISVCPDTGVDDVSLMRGEAQPKIKNPSCNSEEENGDFELMPSNEIHIFYATIYALKTQIVLYENTAHEVRGNLCRRG